METISLDQFCKQQDKYVQEAKAGKIFIYPTDTIYGIGWICTPANKQRIFTIKNRDPKKIYSLIAPDFARIKQHYGLAQEFVEQLPKYLDTYHGITYIFDYNEPGARIIKHPMQNFVKALDEGFISVSCNISGEPVVTSIQEIPQEIANEVDYIIDGGVLWDKASVLIDFVADKIVVR